MNRLLKKLPLLFLLPLALLLLLAAKPANAQTDPTATPDEYPPPATPVQPNDGYPLQRPTVVVPENEEGYVLPPTAAPIATSPPTVIGDDTIDEIGVTPLSQNQRTSVSSRIVLWAGFVVTLFILGLAVYGATLMYTRPRN